MEHKIIVEIDGVRYKLVKIKGTADDACKKCALRVVCAEHYYCFPCSLLGQDVIGCFKLEK